MKTRTGLTAGVFFLLTMAITAHAQQARTEVRVLPTNAKSVIKLLVADNPGKLVTVGFYNEDGLIAADDIKGADAHGFIKKYDLSRLPNRSYKLQVVAENTSFTYQVTKDSRGVVAELRETTQIFPVLAAR